MSRLVRPLAAFRYFAAALLLAPLVAAGAAAPVIPAPTEREIGQFLALQKELVADPSRAAEICSFDLTPDDGDEEEAESPPDPEGARIGRELDAHPLFGPLLRRHGLSGQRYAQVTVQLAGGMLGLAIADSIDSSESEQGRPAQNRAKLLSESAEARVAAAHQVEITAVFQAASELCGEGGGSEEEPDEAEEP